MILAANITCKSPIAMHAHKCPTKYGPHDPPFQSTGGHCNYCDREALWNMDAVGWSMPVLGFSLSQAEQVGDVRDLLIDSLLLVCVSLKGFVTILRSLPAFFLS